MTSAPAETLALEDALKAFDEAIEEHFAGDAAAPEQLREAAGDYLAALRAEIAAQCDAVGLAEAAEATWGWSDDGCVQGAEIIDRLGERMDLDGVLFTRRDGRAAIPAGDWLVDVLSDIDVDLLQAAASDGWDGRWPRAGAGEQRLRLRAPESGTPLFDLG